MKKVKGFEIFLVAVVLSVHLYAALSPASNIPNRWFTRDDAYYYFKVAQNVSEGNGLTFDGINPTNGYHPLWLFVCIPIFTLARFDLILPLRILLIVLAALNAATGVLIYRVVSRTLSEPIAMLAAAYWVFNLYIHDTVTQLGMETGLTAFSIALLLYLMQDFERKRRTQAISRQQIAWLGVAAVVVLFSRLDTIFLVAILGLCIVFRATPLRYLLPLDILIIIAASFASFGLRVGFAMKDGLPAYFQYATPAQTMTLLALLIRLPAFYFLGIYQQPARAVSPIETLKRAALAVTLSSAIIGGIMLVLSKAGFFNGFPRSTLLLDWGITLTLVTAFRLIARWFSSSQQSIAPRSPLEELQTHWREWLAGGAVFYGIVGFSLGAYMLWNKLAFGTASPVSGQIKRWWGTLVDSTYGKPAGSVLDFFGLEPNSKFEAWSLATNPLKALAEKSWQWFGKPGFDTHYVLVALLIIGLCLALLVSQRKRAVQSIFQMTLIPLFVGSELQIIFYNATGYAAAQEWYWVSEMLFAVLFCSLVFDLLLQPLRRKWIAIQSVVLVVAIAISLIQAYRFGKVIVERMSYVPPANAQSSEPSDTDYASFLESFTEPGTLIGMTGGGTVGYFIHGRTIVNMDGLINSYAYFQAQKAGRGSDYLANIGLDYIFANPGMLENPPYRGQYTNRYEIVVFYGDKALMRLLPTYPSMQHDSQPVGLGGSSTTDQLVWRTRNFFIIPFALFPNDRTIETCATGTSAPATRSPSP
jgi:hypothetical protein